MPVPVPRQSKLVAHPVIKHSNCGDAKTIPFQNITRTLPISPTGPPPSFGTREQWINSLPSWRRTKSRRIWEDDAHLADQRAKQDFYRGLTAAGNASVIKGTHAEACIPPLYGHQALGQPHLETSPRNLLISDGEADDEMSSDYSVMDQSHLENESQWSASSPLRDDDGDITVEDVIQLPENGPQDLILTDLPSFDEGAYERGAFTPIFEDESPGMASGQEMGSSPLGPITPFGEFIDRVVASGQPYADEDKNLSRNGIMANVYQDRVCGPQCYQVALARQPAASQRREVPAPAPEVVTPSATSSYKKLAEPLSEWVANYVWKVCTTGYSLPFLFGRPSGGSISLSPVSPPGYLATSVHSLLLSTLLQPSAVFLAIWYIVRLPVYFGAAPLGLEFIKEGRFRAALLGESRPGIERETMEASAPFRLVVLGCMLANKWLDDHTFSNKTWHNISNVPIQALNKLESLALDIFSYDLTVPSRDWSKWLEHIMLYHMSLSSPMHPQPISRPSTNPHSIVRMAIDEIIQAPAAFTNSSATPQPVFLGLEERKREKVEQEQAMAADVLEIDLDEDGPLREEYLPRRRISGAGSLRNSQVLQLGIADSGNHAHDWDRRGLQEMGKSLPPPAKWSPAGDEPIHRERNRISGQYVAVQPPLMPLTSYPAAYVQHQEVGYPHQNWNSAGYVPVKAAAPYILNFPPSHHVNPAYTVYPYAPHVAMSHSRSQSLSFDQENAQSRYHMRSYSQSHFEYKCSDLRMTANEHTALGEADAQWVAANYYPYPVSNFAPFPTYQSAWLRA